MWFVLSTAVQMLDMRAQTYDFSAGNGFFTFILMVIAAVPLWAVAVKRAHDRRHPNWWLFIGLIPIIGPLWLLVELAFLKGTVGTNKYGDDPTTAEMAR